MTDLNSCFECLRRRIEAALKKEGEWADVDSDDDSSVYTDDSDSDSHDEGDYEDNHAEADSSLQQFLSERNGNVVRRGRIGDEEVFHSIMKRVSVDSVETSASIVQVQSAMAGVDLDEEKNPEKPRDRMDAIYKDMGVEAKVRSYKTLDNFFFQHSPEQIQAYDNTVIGAVKRNDLDELRRLHRSGRDLQCSNMFGESIEHTVARRGTADMMKFLLTETDCTLRVCCDSGRNPLHDACWTSSPNFEVVTLILESTPQLLLISDNRNFTPLDYVPRDSWALWCKFLDENKHLLKSAACA